MSGETRTPQLKPTSFEDELDVTFKPLDNAPKTGPGRNDEELNLKWIKTDIEDALDPNGGPTKRPKIKWAGGAGPSEDNHGGELKEPVVDQADRS